MGSAPTPARTASTSAMLLITLLNVVVFRPTTSDPSDEACLIYLSESLQDPTKSLQNWTKSTFTNPCSGFTSYLQGATCNNGRIYKPSLTNLSLRSSISPFLANCTNLQAFDLSSNFLTGPIPQQLDLLVRLSTFDVSNNKLAGPIPISLGNRTKNLPRFNATSFEGNKELYGYPLPPLKSKGLSVLAIVGIGLGNGFASLVLSFIGVCIWLKITERKMALEEGKISHLIPDY